MDFVNRLVERTRSTDRTAVRPVVGPGLIGTDAREPLLVIDELREVVSSPTPSQGTAATAPTPTPTRVTSRAAVDAVRPAHEAPSPLVTPGMIEPTQPDAAAPTIVSPALAPAAPLAIEPASDSDNAPPASVLAAHAPAHASARTAPPPSTPRTARTAAASPESNSGDQVIRVHIGRIDVRAPAPLAAPAAKRAAEPLPSVALGRYLDDHGRRR